MLNSPLPPDVDVTQRLQTVISDWRGALLGYQLDRLYQDCVSLVGKDEQLLPLRIIPVRELDSASLERRLKRHRLPLNYGVDTVGRFEAAMVPVIRERKLPGFLFVYEENLSVQDQIALFAHAVGHLLINHQQRLAGRNLDLDPDEGQIHIDRLAELRYLDIHETRNFLDRKVLEDFPTLTKLIEVPEESPATQKLAMQDLSPLLRRQGWVNAYVKTPYSYTSGRVIPNSVQRGRCLTIDVLLRLWLSLPIAVVHVQRPNEHLEEALRRVRSAAQQLSVPFAYVFTHEKDFLEMDWLSGAPSDQRLLTMLPTRQDLQARWLSALQLTDYKAIEALSYPYQPDQTPRYYQESAINRAVIATLLARRGLRDRRILLTLATGTGKTQVAFQILWKLKQTYQVRRVLFLADRGSLLDQARLNTFGPFKDAIARGLGARDSVHDILFGSYQWLTTMQDGEDRYKSYPANYFDVIVIDECHRGSADENSNWRKILDHFSQAVQIGLTATPLDTEDVQTKKYFGPSVYTYTLSQGINDGFLAPYSVRRVQIGKAAQNSDKAQVGPERVLDQKIVIETERAMRAYTQTIVEHLAQYLRQQDDPRAQKTIVFCVDNAHAETVRLALEAACLDWARPGDIVRIVGEDDAEGRRALDLFCNPRERRPVVVTTAQLLTTGVDVPTCKNIVLARGVGSIVEFKQIIGRGTRIYEPDKTWFTIIDYAGTIKHFFDRDFDGDPVSFQHEYLSPVVTPAMTEEEVGEMTMPANAPDDNSQDLATSGEQDRELAGQTEVALSSMLEGLADEGGKNSGADYALTYEPNKVIELNMDYQETSQDPDLATVITSARQTTSDNNEQASEHGMAGNVQSECAMLTAAEKRDRVATQVEPGTPMGSTAPPHHAGQRAGKAAEKQPQEGGASEAVAREPDPGFAVTGDDRYDLDASARRLHQKTQSDLAQQALKDIIKTPDELRAYWLDPQARELLVEQLKGQVVALDALALSLKLPEVDYFDLLLHVLFQVPTITRAERVRRLRERHSTFFQRFEHSPLAEDLLNAILDKYENQDKYTHEKELDVSSVKLLNTPPINARTNKEWLQAFSQGPTKTTLPATLKELQQLLYSV